MKLEEGQIRVFSRGLVQTEGHYPATHEWVVNYSNLSFAGWQLDCFTLQGRFLRFRFPEMGSGIAWERAEHV